MDSSRQFFIFGDQTYASEPYLRQLLHAKDSVVLRSFFDLVNQALRVEIARLPAPQRDRFPRFTTLLELLAEYRKLGSHPALEQALTCITQLGCFVRHYGTGSRRYPHYSKTFIVGLCAGSFAAAAISTSQTIPELIPAGIEAVLVAFRTGLRSLEARNDIERHSREFPVWSVTVGMQEGQALVSISAFLKTKGLSRNAQPFISAVSSTTVTISGPSQVLEQLLKSEPFCLTTHAELAVYAPYHAGHIYGPDDIEKILAPCNKAVLASYNSKIGLISSATGKRVAGASFASLLRNVLNDILIEQLRWDNVLEESVTELYQGQFLDRLEICPILTSTAQSLASRLSQAVQSQVAVVDSCMAEGVHVISSSLNGELDQSKIAIIGYSGRFPNAENIEEFWELLHKGLDVHQVIPKDRFDVTTHYDPTGKRKNTSKVQHGCFIEKPGLFDAKFFNMSPRESANADPGQRLAITTAYEAMEMAGFVPNRTPSTQRNRVGIVYGMTSDDWREVNSGQDVDTYFIPGGNRAFTPGRINYHFKFSGPSYSVDTACSSSLAAIHIACNALWRGDCDTALAGGTNIMTNPDNFAGLDRGHFLSPTGNCNTFDDGANGYCRADAVGTVILKRLEDAEADNDPIKGVILGAYTNHSAEADSMTRPHVGAQASIFNKVLDSANVNPLDVSYIEMHGTGTQHGDAVEMKSVLDVFAPGQRGNEYPLHLGSVKANVGHAESASGVTSLIKVLKMMEKDEIPPHCGIKTKINRGFPTDLKARNVNIALKPTPWRRPELRSRKRTVFLNNFSAAGGNTALLMEDAPYPKIADHLDPRTCHLVAVSGKSKLSLQKNIQALLVFIDSHPGLSLPSLGYTTTARRIHHNHRLMVNGQDLRSIKNALQGFISTEAIKPIPIPSRAPKVNFVFTGQGTLYAGVARQIYERVSKFRADLQRFDGIGQSLGFPSFLPLINGALKSLDEVDPQISQLGTTCIQMALAELWISWGVQPSAVIGHSLGEYAALHTAGVISVSDAIYLVGTRVSLLTEHCNPGTHSMLAVRAPLPTIKSYLESTSCEVACFNSPVETVLSGRTAEIESLSNTLAKQNLKSTKLDVAFAFHSVQMESILKEFECAAQAITFNKPAIPYISPLLARVVESYDILGPSYLARACRENVNFGEALIAVKDLGTINDGDIWLEIGAHPVCSNMVKAVLGSDTSTISSLRRNQDAWKVLAESLSSLYLAGLDLQWDEFHRDFRNTHEVLQLPSYAWDSKDFWIQYKNDFCLTKGNDKPKPTLDAPRSVVSTLSTSSVQKVVDQELGVKESKVVIESDLNDPSISGTVKGHIVNGVALCPSSLYADIALTIADYLFRAEKTVTTAPTMNVSDMTVSKPLIASGQGRQLFRASGSADWKIQLVKILFYSVTPDGTKTMEHANCSVKFEDAQTWMKDWRRQSYLIKSRMASLEQGVGEGQSHKIKRGLAYKLFGALVDYSQFYQGMQEVIFDSTQLEATARVRFQTTDREENHYISPYWIDSLGHIAGFVMNANDAIDSKRQVFVNHGWDSMRCTTQFSREKSYQTYIKMQNIGGTMYAGDTYIFDGDDVIALFQGVKFQGVPRQVLDNLLLGAKAPKSVPFVSTPMGTKVESASTPKTGKSGVKRSSSSPLKRAAYSEAQSPRSDEADIMTQVVKIMAEEIGLGTSELPPSSNLTDLGIDSLLSLNIASRMREDLGLVVEPSLFPDCSTILDLVKSLSGDAKSPSTRISTRPPTPDADSTSSASEHDDTDITSLDGEEINLIDLIRRTIAEEVGIPETDLTESLDLTEMGMDSLLSLTILGKLRDELEMDLPANLFADNNSLAKIETALGLKPKVVGRPEGVDARAVGRVDPTNGQIPQASSSLLQGNPKSATKILFLFPDGSGSATSYAPLPLISPRTAVYGLNCPYMRSPQDMKCSLQSITLRYLEEIRRRQRNGPYFFGGWSAGGICAFDAAQELERIGEKVERLILIDSPFPVGLEKLPPRLYDFFQSVGLFGESDKPPPSWLLPHFLAFVDSLDLYRAKPFARGRGPPTRLIWAHDGVCKSPESPRPEVREDDPKEMLWLLNNRTDFGSNGWDRLLGTDDLIIETMYNANHFSMMAGENVEELAAFICKAMD